MRLNGAGFLNKYKDIILGKLVCPESSLPSPCLRPANIGSADMKGLELEASIYPVDGFSFDGSISYLDFKYTTPTDAAAIWWAAPFPATASRPIRPRSPIRWAPSTTIRSNPVRSPCAWTGRIRASSIRTPKTPSGRRIPGYFLANARFLGWNNNDNWKVALEVRNLFDKYYYQSVSDITTSLGVVTGVPGMPRTYAVSVERKF